MEFLPINQNDNKLDLPGPILIYPEIQPPTAPSKKNHSASLRVGIPNIYDRLKTVTSITIIFVLVMIFTLGCVAVAVFADKKSLVGETTTEKIEDIFERIEFRRGDWAVFSGSLVTQPTCNQRSYCQDRHSPSSEDFSYRSSPYVLWLDRIFRVSHFQKDFVGTLVTRIKCVTLSARSNMTMVNFHTVWDVGRAGVVLPTPQQLGREVTLQVMRENRDSRRQYTFDLASITIEGTYRSRDDEIVAVAPVPVPVNCQIIDA